jgi:carboxypeptidase C (cathepsin A)
MATARSDITFVDPGTQSKEETSTVKVEASKTETQKSDQFKPEQQQTKGSVTIGGKAIDYDAFAGTLVVHAKGWDDVAENADPDPKNKAAEASMFYVAYFRSDTKAAPRPLTFFYNGGPGSSTVWASHGSFRTQARGDSRRYAHCGCALSRGQQRIQLAGRDGSGFCGRARHRFQPPER